MQIVGGIRIGLVDLVEFSPDRPSQDVSKRRFSLDMSLVALILELAGVRGLLRFQPGGVKCYGNKIICVRAESARSDARRCTARGCSRTSSGVRCAVPLLHESRRAPCGARVPRVRNGPAAASVEGLRHRWCHAHIGSGRHRSVAEPRFLNTRWSPIVLGKPDDGAPVRVFEGAVNSSRVSADPARPGESRSGSPPTTGRRRPMLWSRR